MDNKKPASLSARLAQRATCTGVLSAVAIGCRFARTEHGRCARGTRPLIGTRAWKMCAEFGAPCGPTSDPQTGRTRRAHAVHSHAVRWRIICTHLQARVCGECGTGRRNGERSAAQRTACVYDEFCGELRTDQALLCITHAFYTVMIWHFAAHPRPAFRPGATPTPNQRQVRPDHPCPNVEHAVAPDALHYPPLHTPNHLVAAAHRSFASLHSARLSRCLAAASSTPTHGRPV